MLWKVTCVERQRYDMIQEYLAGATSASAVAHRYGISRKTLYKFLGRYESEGLAGLADRSRRPRRSPRATEAAMVDELLALRKEHQAWGSKKLHARLLEKQPQAPCERTVHRILQRAGTVSPAATDPPEVQRFAREGSNQLWQLDFKSPVYLHTRPTHGHSDPLSILDDHSRFAVGLVALSSQQLASLWPALWAVFGDYGLPEAILTDNANGLFRSHRLGVTTFTMRLWRLDIEHLHGRPYHPQTQGKVERWHRTINLEVLKGQHFETIEDLQQAFDRFRNCYNHERPHEALELKLPRDHYQPSPRQCPQTLPEVAPVVGATARKVHPAGYISVRSCRVRVGEGLAGEWVELTEQDPALVIKYGRFTVRRLLWDDLQPGLWV